MSQTPIERPENAEVDNSGQPNPVVEEFERLNEGEITEGQAGTSDPGKAFRENPPSAEEVAEIEETRKQRLDPENRPENAEINNSDRDFDPETGTFVDEG